MYTALNARLGHCPSNPSGHIPNLLADVTSQIGLPRRYLPEISLCDGCQELDARVMLKSMFKRYYDEKMVSTEAREDVKWLL